MRVLTLNTWGIPVAADRAIRMQAIGKQLATNALDFVGLQEIWLPEDQAVVQMYAAAGGLQYAHYFKSGVIGSGLLVLSRYPIIETNFHRFRLRGHPEKVLHADYYAGKGIGRVRVQTPVGPFDLYNLHPIGLYTSDAADEYKTYRAAALYEAARYINMYSEQQPVIALGDMNHRPTQPGYRILTALGGLSDCYATLHPQTPGATFTPANPYRANLPLASRLDYVFVRNGARISLTPTLAEVTMETPPPVADAQSPPAYSDHFGVLVELEVKADNTGYSTEPNAIKAALMEFKDLLLATTGEARARQEIQFTRTTGGAAAAFTLELARRKVMTRRQFLKCLCRCAALAMMPYTLFKGWQALCTLPAEQQILADMLDEVESLLVSSRG